MDLTAHIILFIFYMLALFLMAYMIYDMQKTELETFKYNRTQFLFQVKLEQIKPTRKGMGTIINLN